MGGALAIGGLLAWLVARRNPQPPEREESKRKAPTTTPVEFKEAARGELFLVVNMLRSDQSIADDSLPSFLASIHAAMEHGSAYGSHHTDDVWLDRKDTGDRTPLEASYWILRNQSDSVLAGFAKVPIRLTGASIDQSAVTTSTIRNLRLNHNRLLGFLS